MIKENLFIKSKQYHVLIKKAKQLIPNQRIIINELYNKVFKEDIEHCFDIHLGKSNKVEIYLYQNYYDTLTFAFIIKNQYSEDILTNLDIYLEQIIERYKQIELFGNIVEDHEILLNVKDIRGVNGLLIKLN